MTSTYESRQSDQFDEIWRDPGGVRGFFTSVQHKVVGTRYMVTAFFFFLLGGILALLMRLQLAQPDAQVLGPQSYNELFTMHGTTMMFLFAVPFLEGLATYLLPLQLGARDMPFPRYNAFNYWCYLLGGLILYSSFLVDMVPSSGWFAYVPLSGPEFADKSMDIWLFGLTLAEIAAVGAAIEIIVAVLKTRAPGMSLDKMPIFAWTMLSVAVMIILAFVPLIVASVLLELDRAVGTAFFDVAAGGDPLLWQHLFWIFGHPEVYVMFLPGAAIISHVIPVHARRELAAYPLVVVAIIVTAIMSLGLWVHHMYAVGLPPVTLSFFTAASMTIAIASGIQVFAWIATLWLGRPRLTVPMLYALGFIVTFVAGGITGVMVASAPFDLQAHDSYFIVAHLHYVLIGGMLFPVFAALFHWWPKMTGRMPHVWLGHVSFWLIFIGFHTTFLPMHLTGMWGMPRRIYTYGADMGITTVNLLSTVGAFIFAAGVLVLMIALIKSAINGPKASADPWGGDTLEWLMDSPAPSVNWREIPAVSSRYPVWNPAPDSLYAEERGAFDAHPSQYRAAPMTTIVAAKPEGTMRLPEASIWPAIPALGLLIAIIGVLVEIYLGSLLGIVVVLAGLAGWARTNEIGHRAELTQPIGGLPVESIGPRTAGWWGAATTASVLIIAAATIAFSSLFLQVNAATWPRDDTMGQPVLMLVAGLSVIFAAVTSRWGAGAGKSHHVRVSVIALVLGVLAFAATVLAWALAGLEHAAHAYNSVALVLTMMLAASQFTALASTGIALLSTRHHERDSRTVLLLHNCSLLWATSLAVWVIAWGTLEFLPRVVT